MENPKKVPRHTADAEKQEEDEVISDRPLNCGLVFPANAVRKCLRAHPELTANLPITDQGAAFLTAAVEYMCAELCDISGNEARSADDSYEISRENVIKAVEKDKEILEVLAAELKEEKREDSQRNRLARCRAATREFRKQFAEYFQTQVEELELEPADAEMEVEADSTAEAQKEQDADMNAPPEAVADMEYESEDKEGEEEEEDESEDAALYFPLIPDALTCSSSSFAPSTSPKTSSSSSAPPTSPSLNAKPEDTCSRFKRLFSNLVIVNDVTDSSCEQGRKCDMDAVTCTTTYRVITPPRLVQTATREITLASGLPAPVVNTIADYSKHDMEGDTITAQYMIGDGPMFDAQEYIIKHNGKRVLSLERSRNTGTYAYVDWEERRKEPEQIKACMQLFNKLDVPLSQEDFVPLMCMLFSPHRSAAATTKALAQG